MDKTIAAVSSAPGSAQRGIIRISGDLAFKIVTVCIDKEILDFNHTWLSCNFLVRNWQVKLPCILYIMQSPHSYTGEDTIEIHTYSSPALLDTILQQLFAEGCSPALPGEFTKRAFLSGKIDLAQAEAVAAMIAAKTEEERKIAILGITGKISERILNLQDKITYVVALMEAHIDFSDEEIEPLAPDYIANHLQPIIDNLQNFRTISEEINTDGIKVCLCGMTNAGKSTFFNNFCDKDASIISEISGTTLDFVEESVVLNNTLFSIIDTPGLELQAKGNQIQAQKQSIEILKNSDIVLFCVDSSISYKSFYTEIIKYFPSVPSAIIYNKADLQASLTKDEIINLTNIKNIFTVSRYEPQGITQVKDWLLQQTEKIQTNKSDIFLNTRQYHSIAKTVEILKNCILDLQQYTSYEFIVGDMRLALEYLGEIVGQVSTEDILDKVFSEFCIGK